MISIQFQNIPKTSPEYKGIDNSVVVMFTDLDINVNRTTLAVLLRYANDVNEEIARTPLVNAAMKPVELLPSESDEKAEKNLERGVLFRMKFSLSTFRVSLIKEQKIFLQTALTNASVDFDLREDSTVNVDLSLAGLGVKDFYDTPWSCMLYTSK